MPSTLAADNISPHERFNLGYLLPRQVQQQLEDIYLHWQGITRPSMGYHVSVLGPFTIAEGHNPEDLAVFAGLCLHQASFRVFLGKPGIFQNVDNQVAYLGLHDPRPMRSLHGALLAGARDIVAAPSPEYHLWTVEQYVPHVTLGIGLSPDAATEFLDYAKSHPLRLHCEVLELSLLKQLGGSVWQQIARYPLQGSV